MYGQKRILINTEINCAYAQKTLHTLKKRLYELAKQYNVRIIFLPPYSPELNPIENFWHWLKKKISDLLKFS